MKYQVKLGMHFGRNQMHKAGDIVELTEFEASGFLDKLELVVEEPEIVGPIDVAEIDGMKEEWAIELMEMGIENSAMFKNFAQSDPTQILEIDGLGPATLDKLIEACP